MHNATTAELEARINEYCREVITGPVVAGRPCTRESHQAVRTDAAAWARVPFLGYQWTDEKILEMRTCEACDSTLAVEIETTARAVAAIVSRDSRTALHFALPAGDVTALRDELEERYALYSEVAESWNCDTLRDEKRLVVSASEDAAFEERRDLERTAEWNRNAWEAR